MSLQELDREQYSNKLQECMEIMYVSESVHMHVMY